MYPRLMLSMLMLGTAACTVPAQTYTDLYGFSIYSGFPPANSDGALPQGSLVITNGILYGTTYEGGSNGVGTVFAVKADGSGYAGRLHSFGALSPTVGETNADGANPHGNLTLADGVLYGTTYDGGFHGAGTLYGTSSLGGIDGNVFSFTLPGVSQPPALAYQRAGNGLTLTWPAGYVLQSTPALGIAFSNAASGGTYTITATNAQQYFRVNPQ